MIPTKRLQVFVSSTYNDLIQERQAAVQAILSSGHIPAGMELFAAGDESQMRVIENWIEQSDVYLLILGGRYGSIEPVSGKSYTQLEYEYAMKLKKPLFAVVVDESHLEEKVKQNGSKVLETKHYDKLSEFRKLVLSRMVRFWSDSKDIKLSIFETLSEFSRRNDLIGWVPGNQKVDTSKMAEELARLGEENSRIMKENAVLQKNQRIEGFKNLSAKRRGFTQSAAINGTSITVTTSEYSDGTVGEIFIDMPKESSTLRSLLNSFASCVSLGLQYGVPLEEYVDRYVFTKFDPSGFVDHPNVKSTTSILDFVFRILGYEYLGRTDLVHVLDKPFLIDEEETLDKSE